MQEISGITTGNTQYVGAKKDPRKTPLNKCVSLGDLMWTLQKV